MPANLSPEFKDAEAAFKRAKSKDEKIAALEEMLAVIPKHKGTDKLQGEIKKRLSKLRTTDEQRVGTGPQANPFLVEPMGAGQLVLMGFPNVGKSALVRALTNCVPAVAPYPFTTTIPQPGMIPHLDTLIQVVDTPPITEEGIPGPLMTTLLQADALMVVADLGSDDVLDQLTISRHQLEERRLLRESVPEGVQAFTEARILWVLNKTDALGAGERLEFVKELWQGSKLHVVSAEHGQGLEELKEACFRVLDVIRVYTKAPGKDPDMTAPFVLPRGSSVLDLAEAIHKEVAASLRGARVWGSAKFDGQAVSQDHPLEDGDVVELRSAR